MKSSYCLNPSFYACLFSKMYNTIIVKSEKIFLKSADCTLVIFISLNSVLLKNIISLSIYRKLLNARRFPLMHVAFKVVLTAILWIFYPYILLNE